MARNNFQYEKRQRELDKKRKADDKAKRKLEPKNDVDADGNVIAQDSDSDRTSEEPAPAALPASPA
ncbi:hypothetical protein AB2N08_22485 [Massilia aurea]|uniref:hypothetical protein n=1 Tax=Massilia aurea TaxID=373040 RepID=UPI0034625D08